MKKQYYYYFIFEEAWIVLSITPLIFLILSTYLVHADLLCFLFHTIGFWMIDVLFVCNIPRHLPNTRLHSLGSCFNQIYECDLFYL